MVIRALTRLNSMVHRLALRRAVACVCAIALLSVTFAHSVHHFSGHDSAVIVQADVGSSGYLSDALKKAPIAIEHCQGCSMIAIAVLAPSIFPDRILLDLPVQRFDERRPHPPAVEIPPPILNI